MDAKKREIYLGMLVMYNDTLGLSKRMMEAVKGQTDVATAMAVLHLVRFYEERLPEAIFKAKSVIEIVRLARKEVHNGKRRDDPTRAETDPALDIGDPYRPAGESPGAGAGEDPIPS